jgi:phosphate transport system permease protein
MGSNYNSGEVAIQNEMSETTSAPGQETTSSSGRTQLSLSRRFRWSEFVAEKTILLTALASLATIALIFVFIFREASALLFDPAIRAEASWQNLLSTNWQPVSDNPKFGLLPLLAGTFKVTVIATLIGAPIAILAAIFTATLAPRWARESMKPVIEILAGFPSVVIGFFALTTLSTLIQSLTGTMFRLNALVGGIALSFAVIPLIYTISEDALGAISHSLREASLALGATRVQTAFRVLLPAAAPGIFAAVLLGIGRAFGETMIVLMATGNAPMLSYSVLEPVRTMSATVGAEMAEVVFGETHYTVLFFIGLLLFLFTFFVNAVAEFGIRRRLMKRFHGQ